MFRFAQFDVAQDVGVGLKVNTDAMLLGAWAAADPLPPQARILDIGCGTGVLALCMAQCAPPTSTILAIDVDAAACTQAAANAAASPWADRITVRHTSLQQLLQLRHHAAGFAAFHAIICNPPYFVSAYLPPADGDSSMQRTLARHAGAEGTDALTYEVLAQGAAQLLAPGGSLFVVLPTENREAERFQSLATQAGLDLVRAGVLLSLHG